MQFVLLFIVLAIVPLHAEEVPFYSGIQIFDAWVGAQVDREEIPGALVGVVYKDKLIWSKAYGKGADPQALFPIASLTKPFTAMAILKLWQEGRLQLDSPIDRYLPGFKMKGYNPEKAPITVRQLLNHTAGMPENPDFPYWNDLQFPPFHTIWKTLGFLALSFGPGEHWKYSHLGYALLGKVVESASSETYQSYLRSTLFTPLKMEHTTFSPEPSKVIQGYSKRILGKARTAISFYDTKGMSPAFGLFSTLDDLTRFAAFFLATLAQESILSTPTRRYMVTATIPITNDIDFGLGLFIRRVQDKILFEHSGGIPGYSSYLSMDPKSQLGLIVLCTSREPLTSWADSFCRWVIKSPPNEVENAALKAYEGRYVSSEGVFYVFVRRGKLALYAPHVRDYLYFLIPDTVEEVFRVQDAAPLTGLNGDKVAFSHDDTGTVSSLKVGNTYFYQKQ